MNEKGGYKCICPEFHRGPHCEGRERNHRKLNFTEGELGRSVPNQLLNTQKRGD